MLVPAPAALAQRAQICGLFVGPCCDSYLDPLNHSTLSIKPPDNLDVCCHEHVHTDAFFARCSSLCGLHLRTEAQICGLFVGPCFHAFVDPLN